MEKKPSSFFVVKGSDKLENPVGITEVFAGGVL